MNHAPPVYRFGGVGGCMIYLEPVPRRLSGRRFWLAAWWLLVQGLWLELTGSLAVAFWMPPWPRQWG